MATEETQSNLEKAFQGAKLEDISIDPEGRVVIKNPEVAARVAQVRAAGLAARANTQCVNNGCGPESENFACTNSQCK
jgi:hypothetical protein